MKQSPHHLPWATLYVIVPAEGKCIQCGANEGLVAYETVPRGYGGLDVLSNHESVCRGCHLRVELEAILRIRQPESGKYRSVYELFAI